MKQLLSIALASLTCACISSTSVDGEQSNLQNLLGAELDFVPSDYPRAGIADNLSTLGMPLTFFDLNLCRSDSSGVKARNAAGVPRDLTITYAAGSCNFGAVFVTSYQGNIRVEDQGGDFAARVTYTNLRRTITLPGGSVVNTLDGTVVLRATNATTIDVAQHTIEHEVSSSSVGSIETTRTRDLTITLTDTSGHATNGALYFPAQQTMAGTISLIYVGPNAEALHVVVSTPVPLVPDFLCAAGFRSGQFHAEATGTHSGQITLRYSCQ